MTAKWTVTNEDTGDSRSVESRAEAEDVKADMEQLGAEVSIEPPDAASDGGPKADVVEPDETAPRATQDPQNPLDQLGESLETDPLSILPGHMIDDIQGQPAINKRGYAMIAERYGVSVKSFIECYPWENDDGRCVARAVAVTDSGNEYQDYATACAEDDDMADQLVELASTRALKRVTGWATGLGIVSYVELSNQLEDAE